MPSPERRPAAVLICHQQDRLDSEGLAAWLATTMQLAGIVVIRDKPGRRWRVAQREISRVGLLGFLDVLAFRVYSWLFHARASSEWSDGELKRLRSRYPAPLHRVPTVTVSNPNDERARGFIARLRPDLIVARCKFILKPEVFELARAGAFALHPGICPEYRNAHGCFWALANRDLRRVGMTLLRIDRGVDTGPVFLQASYPFDEVRESHDVIQHRVVFENLDRIGRTLLAIGRGDTPQPVDTAGRDSAVWGQPRLTRYLKWKRDARRDRRHARSLPAVP